MVKFRFPTNKNAYDSPEQAASQTAKYADKLFPNLPNRNSSSFVKFSFSLLLDIVGFFIQIIPLSYLFYPAFSSYLLYRMYGSGLGVLVGFIEESIPGLGFVPTSLLCWANERYDLISLAGKYVPFINQLGGIKTVVNNIIKCLKMVVYAIIAFFVYTLYRLFFGGGGNSALGNQSSFQ
ncbi:hypothetical protein CYY_002226 [Polysphondylium violaceum]|uniref:Transmembrane protein n=1 Tax=Polysphondylium violaceum TaxID=133409 RepID=A0A8J4UVE0_9MYCE|nr:hypothetical protein CYY_002226 [Polysphondylium violaceum]